MFHKINTHISSRERGTDFERGIGWLQSAANGGHTNARRLVNSILKIRPGAGACNASPVYPTKNDEGAERSESGNGDFVTGESNPALSENKDKQDKKKRKGKKGRGRK